MATNTIIVKKGQISKDKNKQLAFGISVDVNDQLSINGVSVIEGKNGLFVKMPERSYKDKEGNFQNAPYVFLKSKELREDIEDAVLDWYAKQAQ